MRCPSSIFLFGLVLEPVCGKTLLHSARKHNRDPASVLSTEGQEWKDQLCDQSDRLEPEPFCKGCDLEQCRKGCSSNQACEYFVFNPKVAPDGGHCMMFSACTRLLGHPGFTVYLSLKPTSSEAQQRVVLLSQPNPTPPTPLPGMVAPYNGLAGAPAVAPAGMYAAGQYAASPNGVMPNAMAPPMPTPDVDNCTPQCTWRCQTVACDQRCNPKCEAPACQTRCSSTMNTQGCQMECEKPVCAVICRQQACQKKDCEPCETHCSHPMCKLRCPNGAQQCRNVCQKPRCNWDCKKPLACPKPICQMKCETPRACKSLGSMSDELPPIQQGEVVVNGFLTPSSASPDILARPPVQVKYQMSCIPSGAVAPPCARPPAPCFKPPVCRGSLLQVVNGTMVLPVA